MLKNTEGTTKNGQSIDNDIGWKTQNGNKQKTTMISNTNPMKTRGWTRVLEKNMNIPTKNMHFERKRCGVKWHVLLNSSCRWKKRRVINAILNNIMKGKFEHWWSAIPTILTTRTITSHLLSLYIRYMAVVSFILETAQSEYNQPYEFYKMTA